MDEAKQLAIQLQQKILEVQRLGDSTSVTHVFFAGEEINGLLTRLVSPLAEAESAYRAVVGRAKAMGESMASAEATGKASPEYLFFKKLEMYYERGQETFLHTKKLMDLLNAEQKRL